MDNYRKIKLVGRGASGAAFLYERISDHRCFIIKEIPVDQMSPDERQMALNESKVLSMMNHPNIITYLENFLSEQLMFIVMEYAEGGTLHGYLLKRKGIPLTEVEALAFFSQLVIAIQYVHSQNILHRDLKSQNILLNRDQSILKIGDFGISKILDTKTRAFTVVGTPCYLSPELCEGESYNQKSDIWALGCILYELLMLQKPFKSDHLPVLVKKIMECHFDPVPDTYSKEVRQLLKDMLHLDPSQRPSAAQIMAQPFMVKHFYHMYMSVGSTSRKSNFNSYSLSVQEELDDDNNPLSKSEKLWYIQQGSSHVLSLPLPPDGAIWKQVCVGNRQVFAISGDGQLVSWEAQKTENNEHIMRMENLSPDIASVSCGSDFTFCLSESGVVSSMGKFSSGCLGNEMAMDISEPKLFEALFDYNISSVVCGSAHVLVLSDNNELFAWGHDNQGCLGLGKTNYQPGPQLVYLSIKEKVAKVFCGTDCSFVVTEHKALHVCGSNRHNKIAMDLVDGPNIEDVHVFTRVRSDPLPLVRVETIACGVSHTAILTDDGKVYTVGSNKFGQLGWGIMLMTHTLPDVVTELSNQSVISLACGDRYTLAVTQDGSLFAWGKYPASLHEGGDFGVTRVNNAAILKKGRVKSVSCHLGTCVIVST